MFTGLWDCGCGVWTRGLVCGYQVVTFRSLASSHRILRQGWPTGFRRSPCLHLSFSIRSARVTVVPPHLACYVDSRHQAQALGLPGKLQALLSAEPFPANVASLCSYLSFPRIPGALFSIFLSFFFPFFIIFFANNIRFSILWVLVGSYSTSPL